MAIRLGEARGGIADINQEMVENLNVRKGWRAQPIDTRRLAKTYIESVPTSEFGTTTDIRQTPGMEM